MLDLHVTDRDSVTPDNTLIAYRVERTYLVLIQYSLAVQQFKSIAVCCQCLQVPEDYAIAECTFHVNSLLLR